MQKHMVEEAGSRFFEMASSLGRMHERTLSGLADATSKTPLGPVFAINASLARMANESMDTLATRLTSGNEASSPDMPKPVAKTATAPKASAKPKAAAKPKPVAKSTAAPATKPKPAKKPAPAPVKKAPATAIAAAAVKANGADVLVEDVVVKAKAPAEPKATVAKDDLTRINGIGATTAKKLHGAGIDTFARIAKMSEAEFTKLLASLEIKSIRFTPSAWIKEAKTLSA